MKMNPVPDYAVAARIFAGRRLVDVYVSWERNTLTCVETSGGALCTSWMPHDERSPKSPSMIARRFAERRAARVLGKVALGEIHQTHAGAPEPWVTTNEDIVPIDDSPMGNSHTLSQFRHHECGCSDE